MAVIFPISFRRRPTIKHTEDTQTSKHGSIERDAKTTSDQAAMVARYKTLREDISAATAKDKETKR